MTKIRLIETDYPDDPYMNLAMDEAIFTAVGKDKAPDTIRFYQNRNAVILGCFQLADEEVNMDFAKKNNIKIAKRFTGGGAVYHDMGDLNYSIILKDNYDVKLDVIKMFKLMINGSLNAFKSIGIDAESGKLNDVTANGKKIVGAAGSIKSNTLMFHAAALVNTNIDMLADVLNVPKIKLMDKGISSIHDRVINISDISKNDIESVKNGILNGYKNELGFEYYKGELNDYEKELLKKLYDNKYSKDEWNFGKNFTDYEIL